MGRKQEPRSILEDLGGYWQRFEKLAPAYNVFCLHCGRCRGWLAIYENRASRDLDKFQFRREPHDKFEEKSVELGLRERIRSFLFDRILCGHDYKWGRQWIGCSTAGNTPFLHR